MHPLDNPIWTALNTRQKNFAEIAGSARKFPQEVTTLAGFAQPDDAAWKSLHRLLGKDEGAGVFLPQVVALPAYLTLGLSLPLVQMVCEHPERLRIHAESSELTEADVPEMVALAELTRPGPFGRRTIDLGGYIGIRCDGRLAAMAGERLKLPGYTEVSAVCTHPDYAGRGFATALVATVAQRICDRGEIPFLHSREDNTRAIKVYERLGFAVRIIPYVMLVRRAE